MDLGLIVNFEWPGLERGTSESRVRLVDFNHVPASFSLTVSRRRTFPQPETPIRVRLRLTVKLSQHKSTSRGPTSSAGSPSQVQSRPGYPIQFIHSSGASFVGLVQTRPSTKWLPKSVTAPVADDHQPLSGEIKSIRLEFTRSIYAFPGICISSGYAGPVPPENL